MFLLSESCLNHKSGTIRGVAAIYNRFNYSAEKRHALDARARHIEKLLEIKPLSRSQHKKFRP